MEDASGWVKLFRKLSDWEWHDVPNMVSAWVHILVHANYEDRQWHDIMLERGQLVISIKSFSAHIGISERELRTCLDRLEKTDMISRKTTNKYTILTVCNYDKYQLSDDDERQTSDKQTTNERQTKDNQTTTLKEVKNIISIKEKEDTKVSSKKKDFSFCDELLALGVKPIIANDWIKVRKGKHLSQTETAMNGIKKHLVDIKAKYGLDANDAIKVCVEHSWGGCEVEFFKNVTVEEQPTLFQNETKWE